MPRINDVKKFIPGGSYCIDVDWPYLKGWLASQNEKDQKVDLDPDFQRAHVWTTKQQVAYVEYIAREGVSAKVLHWNHPAWHRTEEDHCDLDTNTLVLVDGKQRLHAVTLFMADKLKVFGYKFSAFEDHNRLRFYCGFKMAINNLQTRKDLLTWYLQINAGGTPHTPAELAQVRTLLEKEKR